MMCKMVENKNIYLIELIKKEKTYIKNENIL